MLRGHGGEIYHLALELGVSPAEIQDHSSNVSPLSPPAGLYSLLKRHLPEIEHLPEVDSFSLRRALAARFALPADCFLPSSGTTEWIFALPRVLSPERAFILGPTYGDYADSLRQARVPFEYLLARREEGFRPPLEELDARLTGGELIFLCNPNNPTGVYLRPADLRSLMAAHPRSVFVVDESYVDFHPEGRSLLEDGLPANAVVLYSFSKIFRLPGLRLGVCAAAEPQAKRLREAELPWAVNRLAQVAGPWLLEQGSHVQAVREFVERERRRFLPHLAEIAGLRVFAGEIHFFLLELDRPARPVWEALLRRHLILVREASNFAGLGSNFLRLALKSEAENNRLLRALKEVLR